MVDPEFCGEELQGEADPEGGAEKLAGFRRMTAKKRGGEESAHDGADRGDGEADGVAADHPLAVLRELAAERVPQRFRKRNQEKGAEENDRGLFVNAADGLSEGHGQAAKAHDGAGRQKNAARPPVDIRIVRAHAADELQRSQEHEECGGQNMSEGQGTVIREMRVQGGGWIVFCTARDRVQKHDGAPCGDSETDKNEENYGDPEESYESATRMHILNGLLRGIRRQLAIYIRLSRGGPCGVGTALTLGAGNVAE